MQTRSSPAVHTLHSLARQAQIPDFKNLSKSQLYKKLQEQFNFERLQRANSRRGLTGKRSLSEIEEASDENSSTLKPCLRKKAKHEKLNTIDPIMFTPLKKHTFKFVRSNGTCVLFNVDTLVDYMLSTGDFTDPETRIPFSDTDLKNIDRIISMAKMNKASVYDAKKNPDQFADLKFRRDALQGLERCAGEVITEILNLIVDCDPDEAEMRLVMRDFPMFADLFRQMRDADLEFSHHAMRHYRLFLIGPPNKPTIDDYGLLQVVLNFLTLCDRGEHSSMFDGFDF